jgi:hypothetical protein
MGLGTSTFSRNPLFGHQRVVRSCRAVTPKPASGSFAYCVAQKSHRFVIQGYEELGWNYCDGLVVCDAGEVKIGG